MRGPVVVLSVTGELRAGAGPGKAAKGRGSGVLGLCLQLGEAGLERVETLLVGLGAVSRDDGHADDLMEELAGLVGQPFDPLHAPVETIELTINAFHAAKDVAREAKHQGIPFVRHHGDMRAPSKNRKLAA